jgi:hypothetical protein
MIVQRLTYGYTTAHLPTWQDTSYASLREARDSNPHELPGFFRLRRKS